MVTDVTPTELGGFFVGHCYKYGVPTGLTRPSLSSMAVWPSEKSIPKQKRVTPNRFQPLDTL